MRSLADVTATEFAAALTPETVRGLRIISAAHGIGVLSFTAVAGYLYYSAESRSAVPVVASSTAVLLTGLALVLAPAMLLARGLVSRRLFSPAALVKAYERTPLDPISREPITEPADKCVHLLRTAWTIRQAMLEAAALIPVVALVASILSGALRTQPVLWLNLLGPLAFVGFTLATMPSKDSLCELFKQWIASVR